MRTGRRLLIDAVGGLTWLGMLGVGIGEGQTAAPTSEYVLASEGRGVYSSACAPCHGQRGDGEGPAARSINPGPRDFTAGVFKFRSTPSGALPTESDLFRTITEGVPGTWMPAWEDLLSEEQRWAVVAYVKTLVPDFQFEYAEDAALPLPSVLPATASASEGRTRVCESSLAPMLSSVGSRREPPRPSLKAAMPPVSRRRTRSLAPPPGPRRRSC